MSWKIVAHELSPEEVAAWFAAGSVSTDYPGHLDDNETAFVRGEEALVLTCSYFDGCPTCGGAYEMRWNRRVRS